MTLSKIFRKVMPDKFMQQAVELKRLQHELS